MNDTCFRCKRSMETCNCPTVPCDIFIDNGKCGCAEVHFLPPGSRLAMSKGCSCAILDNNYGRGYHYVKGQPRQYVFNGDCPIHGFEDRR